jgi:hypothetical protein
LSFKSIGRAESMAEVDAMNARGPGEYYTKREKHVETCAMSKFLIVHESNE